MKLGGIVPALVTPFDGNGEVNYEELKKLVQVLLADGADGFYVTGSTGECFLLSDRERIKIAETVIDEVSGRVPVVIHVGKIGADQAAYLAKEAQKAGADAVSSIPPFYYNFSFDEIAVYYETISEATDLPVLIYNYPQYSGVTITADNLAIIMKNCRVGGLKFTDQNLYELEKIRFRYPNLSIMFGKDEMFISALPIGVDGGIGSTYNFMLKKYKRMIAAYEAGDMNEAERLQHEACRIIEKVMSIRDITAAKYLLKRKGIECGDCRAPFAPITDMGKRILDEVGGLD